MESGCDGVFQMGGGRDKHTSKHTSPAKIDVTFSVQRERTKAKSGRHTLPLILALAVSFLLLAPICLPSPYSVAHAASDVIAEESLIQQIAEQDKVVPDALDGAELSDGLANGTGVWPTPPTTDTDNTIKWLIQAPGEVVENTIPGAAGFLVDFLRDFVLNPNIAIDGVGQTDNGLGQLVAAISPSIKAVSQIMYAIAIDLLLLLFILSIWRYWVEAAWRGGGNHFAPIARLIFTAGIITAWPTIYAFEVELSNEMIHAIFFRTAAELDQLGHAINIAIAGAISALVGLALEVIGPLVGTLAALPLGPFAPILGGFIGFVGGILFLIPGTIIILELVAIIVLKSIQTCVLIAQYMFAPVFLVFFASPDTEYIPKTFVKSFIEVSMWTFVWVGLLRILVIVMNSNVSLWAEILLVIGVLQMMLSAPEFMGRAHISPASELLTAGLLIRGLSRGAQGLGGLANDSLQAFSKMTARGQIGGQRNTGAATTAPILGAAAAGAIGGAALAAGATTPGAPGSGPTPPPGTNGTGGGAPVGPTVPPGPPLTPSGAGGVVPPGGPTPPTATPGATLTPGTGTGTPGPITPGRAMANAAGAGDLVTPDGTPLQPGHLNAMAHSNWTGRNMMGAFLRVFGARSLYGLGIRFGPSPDNNAHFEADPRTGEITNMNTPVADPADRDEAGRLKPDSPSAMREAGWRLVAGMTNHVATDSTEGKAAAREAAVAAGAMRPQNARERLMEASLRANGQRFEDTDLAKQHLAQGMHEQTVAGVQAYLNGQQGNAVTDYFRRTHGENRTGLTEGNGISAAQVAEGNAFQPMMQNLLRREADSRNPDSGINPDQRGMTGFLDPNGYQPNNLTRAVAANPYLRQLPKGLQRAAFEGAWDCMSGIQAIADGNKRAQTVSAANPQGVGLTEDEVIDLWHETAPFFGESKIRAMMSMRSAGISTSNPQMVQDVAEIGQALGGAIPAYSSAVGLGVGLASSLGPLRSNLAANPGANGGTLGQLVTKCNGMGLDLREPDIMQAVVADVQDGTSITPARAQAMIAIQSSHRAGTSPGDRQMVTDVAAIGSTDSDYRGAVGIVGDLGTAAVRTAMHSSPASYGSSIPELVLRMTDMGLNPGNDVHRQAVVAIVENGQDLNRATVDTQIAMQQHDGTRGSYGSAPIVGNIVQVGQALGGDFRQAPAVFSDLSVPAVAGAMAVAGSSFGQNVGELVTRMSAVGLNASNSNHRQLVTILAEQGHDLSRANVETVMQLQANGSPTTAAAVTNAVAIGNVVGNYREAPVILNDLSVPSITGALGAFSSFGTSVNDLVMRMPAVGLNPGMQNHRRIVTILADQGQPLTRANVETVMQLQASGAAITPQVVSSMSAIGQVIGNFREAPAIYNDFNVPDVARYLSPNSSYGASIPDLVMRMPAAGLNPQNTNHRRIVTLLADGGHELNRRNVETVIQLQATGNSTAPDVVNTVSTVSQALGGRPSDYGTAIDIQKEWGDLSGHLGQGQLSNVSDLGALVVQCRGNRLDLGNRTIRQAVHVMVANDQPVNDATSQAITAIYKYDPADSNLQSAGNISAIAEIGAADGGRPQNYANAVHVLDSSFAIEQGIGNIASANNSAPATDLGGVHNVVRQLHTNGVNVSHPQVQTVIVETLQSNPQMFQDSGRYETVVKGIVLAANNVPPQSLQSSDVIIATSVASEASQSHFDPNNERGVIQQVSSQLPNLMRDMPQYFTPGPNVSQAQVEKNLKLAALAMKNIRDELSGRNRPPSR
jgi:hypothetical protein